MTGLSSTLLTKMLSVFAISILGTTGLSGPLGGFTVLSIGRSCFGGYYFLEALNGLGGPPNNKLSIFF